MDIFLEKLITRKKTFIDALIIVGIVLLALLLIVIVLSLRSIGSFAPIIVVAIGYVAYLLIRSRNIEYEYIVTNGDLDIDVIVAQRKRKRIFSGNCKDFEVLAKMTSGQYDHNAQNIKKRINATTSMNSTDIYFITTTVDGEKTIVFFEPHGKMVESFKKFIPRKVFE